MIEIHTLGRTSVAVNGEPLTGEAAWPKSLALIVYMAREPGPDRREEILGVLWSDRDEKRARRALNQLLYTLRKASPELDLESVKGAVDFGREVWLDVEEFERRLGTGDLTGAVELYRGPFLADLSVDEPEFDHWADRQRADLRRKFRKAALQLAGSAKRAGDLDAAVTYCRRLLESDPLDDEAQHLLIECLYQRGNRVSALRQYETYRNLLAQELEVEPLEHTQELVARIRAERAAGEAVPGAPRRPPGGGEEDEARRTPAEGAADVLGRPAGAGEPGSAQSRRRLGLGTLLTFAILAVLSVWLWPRDAGEIPAPGDGDIVAAEATAVAVLPFEPHGLGPDTERLPDGVAQLLAIGLDGLGPIRTIDHLVTRYAWEQSELSRAAVPTPSLLSALAAELGASSLVLGDIHVSGGEVRLVAELVSGRDIVPLARADVSGSRDSLFHLVDELSLRLAEEVWKSAEIVAPLEAARGTHSLAALKHFLRAEVHHRRAEWQEAVIEYRAAVEADSAFLPALRALAETIQWTSQSARSEATELLRRARELAAQRNASERDRLYDEALDDFDLGDGAAAVRALEDLAERYPDDFSVLFQLADAYFHFAPRLGLSIDQVRTRFLGLLERDSLFAPAMDHLWWAAMWQDDEAEARRWADAYVKTAPLGTRSQVAPIATAIRYGDDDERGAALRRLGGLGRDQAILTVLTLALGSGGDPARAAEAANVMVEQDQSRARRALGAEMLAALEFARGRGQEGYRHLNSAESWGLTQEKAQAWRAVVSLYRLGDESVESYPQPPLRPDSSEPRLWVRDTWLYGALSLRGGDRRAAQSAALRLADFPDGTPIGALAGGLAAGLRADLALAAGDTIVALSELRAAVRRYDGLALLSAWETLPYYRYKLGQLEAAKGNQAAAARLFRSFDDRSLGDLLFRKRAYLALGSALEALDDASQAAAAYAAAARW
ncbi:MAG: hypothetical protein JSU87_10950 [Gemmatimonadota bacterium]|nr:MAG: hypothetical protein JSU87_10950 [Gemmatimonadota bacterium]